MLAMERATWGQDLQTMKYKQALEASYICIDSTLPGSSHAYKNRDLIAAALEDMQYSKPTDTSPL